MKQNITSALLALLCLAACTDERVIDRPAFKAASGTELLPVKVEQNREATTLHFHIRCADWRNWKMTGARLEAGGQSFACLQGRILTREGAEVIADEPFEFGKEYERDARRDSVILTFEPLPRGTKAFDFIEENAQSGPWTFSGIRLDGKLWPELLPAYKPRQDDGKPLEPLSLKYGLATATFTMHGDSIGGFGWAGDPSSDPITGDYRVESTRHDSCCQYSQPAYTAVKPLFIGPKIDARAFGNQYDMILIPGETLTVDFDPAACLAQINDFAAGKPSHQGYRLGGTIGDINEVMLDYREHFFLSLMPELPKYDEVKDFPQWRERLWQNIDTLRQGVMERQDYTRRQKDFFQLLMDRAYVRANILCIGLIASNNRMSGEDSRLEHIRTTYTLVDPHAGELQYFRDGRSYYFPLTDEVLPYFEANGLTESEPYKMTKAQAEAKRTADEIRQGRVLQESRIDEAHPYFRRVLREFNDSTRAQLERMQNGAEERKRPTPDVPGDRLLEHIAREHRGKVVFFDLWATWCGPCKRGIEAMEPLKQELEGKDVVFVYLTNESSPMKDWSESVLRIPGLHYRIPTSKWKEIPIPGSIPQYYLYDRQGRRLWEQTGFSSSVLDEIRQQIDHALR